MCRRLALEHPIQEKSILFSLCPRPSYSRHSRAQPQATPIWPSPTYLTTASMKVGGAERGEDVLLSPPSSIDATAVGGADGAGEDGGASLGVPRVELAYEPRYQR